MRSEKTLASLIRILLPVLLGPLSLCAQPSFHCFGGLRSDVAVDMAWLGNSAYVLADSRSFGARDGDMVLMKLSSGGALEWAKAYSTNRRDVPAFLEPADGGLLLLGRALEPLSNSLIDDACLLKVDAGGNLLWRRCFGEADINRDEHAGSLLVTESGDILLGLYDAVGYNRRSTLMRLTSEGEPRWSYLLDDNARVRERITGVVESNDGYWAVGALEASDTNSPAFLARFDGQGNILIWKALVFQGLPILGDGMTAKRLGDGLVIGCSVMSPGGDKSLLFMRVDAQGDIAWVKRYGGAGEEQHLSLEVLDNSHLLAAGSVSDGPGGPTDGLLLELNADGTLLWAKRYGGGAHSEVFFRAKPGPLGNIWAVGSTDKNESESGKDVLLVRTNREGEPAGPDCNFSALSLSELPAGFTTAVGGSRSEWLVDADYDFTTTLADMSPCPGYCCDVTDTVDAVICRGEAYSGYSQPGYYIDTLNQAEGCILIRHLLLDVLEPVLPDTAYATICEGQSFQGFSAPGIHYRPVEDVNGCPVEQPLVLEVLPAPEVLGVRLRPPSSCAGNDGAIEVDATGNGILYYGLDSINLSPDAQLESLGAGQYVLFIQDETGCTKAVDNLLLPADCSAYIPNAFSPNGDGRNDYFAPYVHPGATAEALEFKIFDRYGGLVFDGKNVVLNQPSSGWDGRFRGEAAAPGLYTYLIKIRFQGGKAELFKGGVQLLR